MPFFNLDSLGCKEKLCDSLSLSVELNLHLFAGSINSSLVTMELPFSVYCGYPLPGFI